MSMRLKNESMPAAGRHGRGRPMPASSLGRVRWPLLGSCIGHRIFPVLGDDPAALELQTGRLSDAREHEDPVLQFVSGKVV